MRTLGRLASIAAIAGVVSAVTPLVAPGAEPTAYADELSNLANPTDPQVSTERIASSGFFAEGGLGAVAFLPKVQRDAALGPSLSFRIGRHLFSWFSLGLFLAASSHEATVPPPPSGEWFQLYRGGADGRLGGHIGPIALFVEGGAGISMISSNILSQVMITDPGEHFGLTFHGGGGLAYQLLNRHYAIGIGVDAFYIPQFSQMKAIDSRIYLRYTY